MQDQGQQYGAPPKARGQRPRPSTGGAVYGRPRAQSPDDGNDPQRRGYNQDNIDH
jgi:hypothetical protein